MRKNFLTGLAILLPMALTFWILNLLINLFTKPFIGIVESFLNINVETLPLTVHSLVMFAAKICILLLLAILTFLVGYLGQHFIVRNLLKYSDYVFHRIPFVNKIYKATQDVVKTLFHEEHTNFSQVVLVPFPHETSRSIGLITKRDQAAYMDSEHGNMVSVFVPGTPNPTMGFMLLFHREQLIFTEMSVEEALKFVISCGVMADPFKK